MLDLLIELTDIIGNETLQQDALLLIVTGAVGLGVLGLLIRLVSKIKALAMFGG